MENKLGPLHTITTISGEFCGSETRLLQPGHEVNIGIFAQQGHLKHATVVANICEVLQDNMKGPEK